DDARVYLLHALVAQAAARERTRSHRLDHRIAAAHEVEVGLDGFGLLQIEDDALLAAVQVPVQQRDAVDDREGHLADVVPAARTLHLDDLGTEVRELHPDRAGTEERALDHPHPREQTTIAVRILRHHRRANLHA